MDRDSQVVEAAGRYWLSLELFHAGIEVARAERDRGVDLVAYVERDFEDFRAVPIQLKASSMTGFGVDRKYARARGLLLVFVWWLADRDRTAAFAMTYPEGVAIVERLGYAWEGRELWTSSAPAAKLVEAIEPYRMTPEAWRARLAGKWAAGPMSEEGRS